MISRKLLFKNRVKVWQGRLLLWTLLLLKMLAKGSLLKRSYRSLLVRKIRQTGLFHREYYLEDNADVRRGDMSPLRHYIACGDREGRVPMPLFDPAFYRQQAQDRLASVNTLLHYVYVGRYLGCSPSPWFDLGFYLAHNKDVAKKGTDPLLHYLKRGGAEGRSPCTQFDGSRYLDENQDVMQEGGNALIHYLRIGRFEGCKAYPVTLKQESCEENVTKTPGRPVLPDVDSWQTLKARSGIVECSVTVIIPVYKGHAETLRCIHSVLAASAETPFELVVINDASPDVELVDMLTHLSGEKLFTLISNPENLGFVQTVNRGMLLHPDRHVVLLNSDTEVYDGWLDRLHQAAQRNERTATVTPLSNNATICSYPHFLSDNPFPLELSYAALDRLAAKVNHDLEVEVPTSVGFCVYIKRECLNDVGVFDANRFGRGYGEENDFSQRAINNGWCNIVAPNVFVRHWGATSFRGEKAKRVQNALKILDKLYPAYKKDVDGFIKKDPLAIARQRLDRARLKALRKKRNVLIVNHNRGGGSERHVQEDIAALTEEGAGVYLMRPQPGRPANAMISHPLAKILPNIPHYPLKNQTRLLKMLREVGITEIHTHSLVDFIPDAPDYLTSLVKSSGVRWEVNLHDYKVICPRINLVDSRGFYCGERSESDCNKCLPKGSTSFGVIDIRSWREMHRRALSEADSVLVPDEDVALRFEKYFPDISFEVSPHEKPDELLGGDFSSSLASKERLRLVVIGAIGKIKGFDVLRACALHARKHDLPLDFIVMGYSMNDRLLQAAGVEVTGKYQEENAVQILKDLSADLVWLPSVWPETYSYTLSIALKAGLPVAAFDIGAIARRLKAMGKDEFLMPMKLQDSPGKINSLFVKKTLKACIGEGNLEKC